VLICRHFPFLLSWDHGNHYLLSGSIDSLLWAFHINGIIHYMVFCDWLLKITIMSLRFIHVVEYISFSFLFIAKPYPIVDHILLIPLSIDGHLDCFHFGLLWIMQLYTFMFTFGCTYVFISPGYTPRSGIARSGGSSMFNLLKNCLLKWPHNFTVSLEVYDVLISMSEGSKGSMLSISLVFICLFSTHGNHVT
jgi:hypothetical protein